MCIEIANNNMNANLEVNTSNTNNSSNKKKLTYSVKKLLKQIFKQTKKCERKNENIEQTLKQSTSMESLESLESLDNQRNASIETECASLESYENEVNERRHLSSSGSNIELEDCDIADINACTMPVRFVRSAHGTFFWTAGASDWAVDNDLIEPLYCCTANQIAVPQDRWAQA